MAAAQEKEKGNAAFKAGDYPTAIGHYSAAIHADRTDATFPLNRAAAYLKLGKNEDAERDCSTVLSLSKGNVKALFRRAQARVAMGKLSEAQRDLNEAAKLEPANQSVKEDLRKVAEMIQKAAVASTKKSKSAPLDISSSSTTTTSTPKRRRVPITIVEPDGRRSLASAEGSNAPPATKPKAASTPKEPPKPGLKTRIADPAADLMKPVSSRPLNGSASSATASASASAPSPPQPQPQPTPKPSSFKDAKSARDNTKQSLVGGGIFRASGESTIFTPREAKQEPAPVPAAAPPKPPVERQKPAPSPPATPAAAVSSAPPTPPAPAKSPMTLFEFNRAWDSTPPTARLALLLQIPPGALPSLFQTSLEPTLFVEIVDALGAGVSAGSADPELVGGYMRAFASVPRFGTVVRFLSAAERGRVRGVWSALGVGVDEGSARPAELEEVWGAVYR